MTISIDKEAAKLYKEILAAYKADPDVLMSELLDKYLAKYNDTISDQLNKTILGMMGSELVSNIVAVPLTTAALSTALYNNAKAVTKTAIAVLNDHLTTGATLTELRAALYEGYGYDNLLDIKTTLPKYLRDTLTPAKLARLKTKPLKDAYLKVLDSKNDRELAKALKNAVYEKSRYYANRIAITEEQRAWTLANADRQIKAGVKFVRWTLSSLHKTACMCEFYAYQDVGYGPGIYPLLSAPAPVYSTHPHCKCTLRDVHRPPTYNQVFDPSRKALERFSEIDQQKILGSKAKWFDWYAGSDAVAVYDKTRRGYASKTIGDLFNKIDTSAPGIIFDPTVMSREEAAALKSYTSQTGYQDMRALYYAEANGEYTDLLMDQIGDKKIGMDDVFTKYSPNANPTEAYRGLVFNNSDDVFDMLSNLDAGDVYEDVAPTSWTASRGIADIYAQNGDPGAFSVILKVLKGDTPIGYDISTLSLYPVEQEILVAPRTLFTVIDTEVKDNLLTIVLEVK